MRKKITPEELWLSHKLRTSVGPFTALITKVHAASVRLSSIWTLSLRLLDIRGNARNLRYTYDINLDFSLRSHGDYKDHACKGVRISYNPKSDPDAIAAILP